MKNDLIPNLQPETSAVVSGKIVYDAFGRTIYQYHPFEESIPSSGNFIFNDLYNINEETAMLYDVMDRQTRITLPDGSITAMAYGFGNDAFGVLRFKTATTDANGNSMETYTDYRQLQTSVKAPYNTETKFVYSPLGELLTSIDPEGLQTSYLYNMLGQMIMKTSPDAGREYYEYDKAGNMTAKITPNTNASGLGKVTYTYFYNLLTHINYPMHPENNVRYYYGLLTGNGPLSPVLGTNTLGRLALIEDAAGFTAFSYGSMGEVTEEYRTFVLPGESETFSFRTGFEYDSWNRLTNMVYPDEEKMHYGYDLGGQLTSIGSSKFGNSTSYIDSISYNKFGQRNSIFYGNGTYGIYSYDILQRLTGLQSFTANNEMMQDIVYDFDPVGNIMEVHNGASALQNGLGGKYDYHYKYDDLYRLIHSSGMGDNNTNYDVGMDYTPNGKIKRKKVGGIGAANNAVKSKNTVRIFVF